MQPTNNTQDPRTLRLRLQNNMAVALFPVAAAFCITVLILLLSVLLEDPLTWWLGTQTTARIEKVATYRGWPDDGHNYDVTFRYDTDTIKNETGYDAIDTKGGPKPSVGQSWPALYRRTWSGYAAKLENTNWGIGYLYCLGFFALAPTLAFVGWGTVAITLLLSDLQFARYGSVSAGVIHGKRKSSEKAKSKLEVIYRFTTTDGREQLGSADVLQSLFDKLNEGDRVSVVYLPNDPSKSRLHRQMVIQIALVE